MKILVAGDVHGNARWAERLCAEARAQNCSWIAQCGDWGFWSHTPKGAEYVRAWERLLDHYGLRLCWIDGNHENHTMLRADYPVHADTGWATIGEGVYYATRGSRWRWDDVTFLALGGAFSIDKKYRVPHQSWWPEELITADEADRAKAGGQADVMLTHDCPSGVNIFGSHHDDDWYRFPEADRNRDLLLNVVTAVRPRLLFHGHFHVRHSSMLELANGWRVQVEGLACDEMGSDAFTVFDTEKFKRATAS